MKAFPSGFCLILLLTAAMPTMGLAAPPNDAFASPILIDGIPASETGSNLDATLEAGEPVPEDWAGYAQASVWFSWTASFSGPLRIDTLGSDFDTMLAVWTGAALDSLSLIAHNDDFNSYLSRLTLWVDDGVTYQIAVYGWDTSSGTVVLNLDQDTNSIISGTVTGPDGTTALQGIQVDVYRWSGTSEDWGNWDLWTSGQTGSEGDYIVAGLPEGEYRVGFWDPNKLYAEQFFENATEIRDATVIELPAEQTEVTGIDASLVFSSRITGTVTGPDGTTPLADIEVTAYTMSEWDWDPVDSTTTDADGHYEILGLREGSYRVVFGDPDSVYIDEAYDNNVPAQPEYGTDIDVPAETTLTGIDASLAIGSTITGTVTGLDGTTPLADIWASAFLLTEQGREWMGDGLTGTDGAYTISGLPTGSYVVEFWDDLGRYCPEYYDDAADLDSATEIEVPRGGSASGIDASLPLCSTITGTVTGPDGVTPLGEIVVWAYTWSDEGWDPAGRRLTGPDGTYEMGGLAAGNYRLQFVDWSGEYVDEVYDNMVSQTLEAGTDIVVPVEGLVTGIDASLTIASKISGRVTGSDGTTGLSNIYIVVERWTGQEWEWFDESSVDFDGTYQIAGLSGGTHYRVQFSDGSGEYIPNEIEMLVPGQTVLTGADVQMSTTSTITGRVTGPDGTTPLKSIFVFIERWNGVIWDYVGQAITKADGSYELTRLRPGVYKVFFRDDFYGEYVTETYVNPASPEGSPRIFVPIETVVTGIDASLALASKISGTVTGPDGTTPIQDVRVEAKTWTGQAWEIVGTGFTGEDGAYTVSGLPAGTFRVHFSDMAGEYAFEVYDNVLDMESGTDVIVPAATTVTGVDVSLDHGTNITGTVTGPDGTTPLAFVWVAVQRKNGLQWEQVGFTSTFFDGIYNVGGLPPGTYRVEFRDGKDRLYAYQAYANAPDLASATDIVVTEVTTIAGIDASLGTASKITGTVTGPDGTMPLSGINAEVFKWNGTGWNYWGMDYMSSSSATGPDGTYTIDGLSAGTYRVVFVDIRNHRYVPEFYDGAPDLESSADIVVPAETTVGGIDASLASRVWPEPASIIGISEVPGTPNEWELNYTGTAGAEYLLQEAASTTAPWTSVGLFQCEPGANTILRQSSSQAQFWRLLINP